MRFLFTLSLILFAYTSFSQARKDTVYYTSEWKETGLKKIVAYYGIKDYDSTGRGIGTYYRKNGSLHSVEQEYNDAAEGLSIWYYENGIIESEAYYSDDILNGEYKSYTEKGQLEFIKTYRNDSLIKRIDYNIETGEIIKEKEGIAEFPDVEAQFPGGAPALQLWIAQNVNYPQESIIMNEQGRVYLSFVVEPDGSISNVEVVKSVSPNLDQEGMRLVRSMPKWIPGEAEGDFARTRCQIPINFTLNNGKTKRRK